MKEIKAGTEWFNEKEVTRSTFPYLLTFWTLRHFPHWFTNFVAWCVSLFYYIFIKRCRVETLRYQNILKEYYPDFKKVRPLRQVVSFAISIIEKIDCWTSPIPFENIHFNGNAVYNLIDRLNNGKGAFVMISHLGNFEVLRSLANINDMGVKRNVPIAILSDMDTSSNFTKAVWSLNPEFVRNLINVNNISPATVERLQTVIENGGFVVCAGDRLSKNRAERLLVEPFLGRPAPFSYGAYFLADLVGAPVYYIWGFRNNDIVFGRKFQMFVEKSAVVAGGPRRERDGRIMGLCREYAAFLERYVKIYPYQWYNFFDFWTFPEEA